MQSRAEYQPAKNQSTRRVHSPQFQNAQVTIEPRPNEGRDDEQNTAQTIEWMLRFADADASSGPVQRATRQAIGLDPARPANGIFAWIRSNVEFQEDALTAMLAGLPNPGEAEVLIRPADLLAMAKPAGDCDDFTMLAMSMLQAAGIPSQAITIEQDPDMTGQYSHVYAEALIDGRWRPYDTSHGNAIGWKVDPVPNGKKRIWSSQQMRHANGLGFTQTPIPSTSTGFNWGNFANIAVDATGRIISAFRTPNFNPYDNADPDAAADAARRAGLPPASGTRPGGSPGGIDTQTLLLFGAVGLVLVVALKK